jgi:heme exporter protein A
MATGQASSANIRLDNIAVLRGNRLVLQNFSLHAVGGDIIWIRGANGCGKSTLLRSIAGLLPMAAGQRLAEGKLTLADENLGLDANASLGSALGFWADLDDADANRIESAMAAMDLIALADVPVRYLSSGQRRRATLARVMASGAAIWLLDEPYNGLDNANTARLNNALLKHAASGGISIVAAHQQPTINVTDSIALDERKSIKAA